MKKGLKDKFDSTTDSMKDKLNEKKINKQQAKYEKEKKKKEDAKKAAKYGGILLAILFIFGVVFAITEDEPTKVPSEPVVVSSTGEKEDTPATGKKEDKDSEADSNDISDENKIGSETNPITIDNCPEFVEILACRDSYDISYVEFAKEHYGEYVEFVANIQDIYSEYEYGEYWGHVLLCGGEFPGENVAPVGPYFRDERAEDKVFDDANFGPHEDLHPYGMTVKVKAILRLYDEKSQTYEIELKSLSNLKARTELT